MSVFTSCKECASSLEKLSYIQVHVVWHCSAHTDAYSLIGSHIEKKKKKHFPIYSIWMRDVGIGQLMSFLKIDLFCLFPQVCKGGSSGQTWIKWLETSWDFITAKTNLSCIYTIKYSPLKISQWDTWPQFGIGFKRVTVYVIRHYFRVQLISRFWTSAEIREGLISWFFWCFHYSK